MFPPPLWAVHIMDSQIRWDWCVGGFVAAGLLVLAAAWRIRDEEIPRIALLTAAFFVGSFIHVPIPAGPKTHLILSGLLGVVLGRRAPLAILVGLFLQSALNSMEGVGFSVLGVNTCVMSIPALLTWGLFAGLQRLPFWRRGWFRAVLVAGSALLFGLSLVYAVAALVSNYGSDALHPDLAAADRLTFHPLTLTLAGLLALAAVWVERRLDHTAEFPLGLLLGEISVLATILLNGLALIFGGTENWSSLVLLTFVIHLPLAVVEGIILGFTVGFLTRVKPQLLSGYQPPRDGGKSGEPRRAANACVPGGGYTAPLALLLALPAALWFAGPARAHRLEADYRVLPDRRVAIESWFDITADSPRGARVRVLRANGELLCEGELDVKGLYVFRYDRPEALTVQVLAGQGHARELKIPKSALEPAATADGSTSQEVPSDGTPPRPFADRSSKLSVKDVLFGVGFLLAVAAFVLSVRNHRRLQEWTAGRKAGDTSGE